MTKHPPTHRVAVSAVIRDDAGRVLLSRRADSGWWNLPGGGTDQMKQSPKRLCVKCVKKLG